MTPEEENQQTGFGRRAHGSHKTYEAGCRGPLCYEQAKRVWRDKKRRQAIRAGKSVKARVGPERGVVFSDQYSVTSFHMAS